ncbi:MAG TPA: flagellar hook-associated protein FlgL [Stellaceae bacterium]|nr:flagellar hook-associated protein FlgL [Stellaceae bacterium]
MRISTTEFFLGSLNDMLAQEATVNKLNGEIATGQTVTNATDNPTAAAAVLDTSNQIDQISTDVQNAQAVSGTMNETLGVLNQVDTLLNQVQSTALQGSSATSSAADRQALASSVQGSLQELMQLANTQLANGQYIFAGSQATNAPFQMTPTGQVVFKGDAGVDTIEIGPSLKVPVAVSGQSVFMQVPDGNGSFAVAASGTNTGTGVASLGGVLNASLIASEHLKNTQFDVSFTAGAGGTLNYSIASGTGVPGSASFTASSGVVASGAYNSSSAALSFGGMDISFSGTLAAGDHFMVRTSQTTNAFQALQDIITALQAPIDGASGTRAQSNQLIEDALATLNQVHTSVLSAEASLGTSLSEINAVQNQDNAITTTDQANLATIQSASLPNVMSQFSEGVTALQAAQAAFGKISGLSLFKYI